MAKVLADDDRGQLRQEGNACISESHIEDAAEFRVRSPQGASSGGGGKFAGDVAKADGGYRQIGALLFGDGTLGPEIKLIIHDGSPETTDANEVTVFQVVKGVVEFLLPVRLSSGGSNLPVPPDGFQPVPVPPPAFLKNGPYELHLQSDRNLVLYDTTETPWRVLWSSGTQV